MIRRCGPKSKSVTEAKRPNRRRPDATPPIRHIERSALYAGQFGVGLASGFGRFADNDGGVFVGQFAKGEPEGLGSYIGADGTVAQGRIKDGKPDGMLLITAPNGKQTLETWKNGEKVK